jgi:hypothetical protein
MPIDSEIIIVSGLPRSGTSLMMQMLERGGIPVMTDGIREADTNNPRGYLEFEQVKKTKEDPSWLPSARGRAVKMVSSLLYDLPHIEKYRVVFMQRDIDEVLASQETMLKRLGRATAPADQMKKSFAIHLKRLFEWLPQQAHIRVVTVSYNSLLSDPDSQCRLVVDFLDGRPKMEQMLTAVDRSLYRNRIAEARAQQV